MSAEVDALDRALARAGEDIVLRRTVGTTNQVNLDVTCRAAVRAARPDELLTGSGMSQTQIIVVLSPTEIARAQWPGGQPPGQIEDPSIPKVGDKLIVKERIRNVLYVNPIMVAGELVRFDIWATG